MGSHYNRMQWTSPAVFFLLLLLLPVGEGYPASPDDMARSRGRTPENKITSLPIVVIRDGDSGEALAVGSVTESARVNFTISEHTQLPLLTLSNTCGRRDPTTGVWQIGDDICDSSTQLSSSKRFAVYVRAAHHWERHISFRIWRNTREEPTTAASDNGVETFTPYRAINDTSDGSSTHVTKSDSSNGHKNSKSSKKKHRKTYSALEPRTEMTKSCSELLDECVISKYFTYTTSHKYIGDVQRYDLAHPEEQVFRHRLACRVDDTEWGLWNVRVSNNLPHDAETILEVIVVLEDDIWSVYLVAPAVVFCGFCLCACCAVALVLLKTYGLQRQQERVEAVQQQQQRDLRRQQREMRQQMRQQQQQQAAAAASTSAAASTNGQNAENTSLPSTPLTPTPSSTGSSRALLPQTAAAPNANDISTAPTAPSGGGDATTTTSGAVTTSPHQPLVNLVPPLQPGTAGAQNEPSSESYSESIPPTMGDVLATRSVRTSTAPSAGSFGAATRNSSTSRRQTRRLGRQAPRSRRYHHPLGGGDTTDEDHEEEEEEEEEEEVLPFNEDDEEFNDTTGTGVGGDIVNILRRATVGAMQGTRSRVRSWRRSRPGGSARRTRLRSAVSESDEEVLGVMNQHHHHHHRRESEVGEEMQETRDGGQTGSSMTASAADGTTSAAPGRSEAEAGGAVVTISPSPNVHEDDDTEEEEDAVCRICQDEEPKSTLFSPCRCDGSSKYVHRECLAEWRASTTNPEHRRVCAECKSPYRLVRKRKMNSKLISHGLVSFAKTCGKMLLVLGSLFLGGYVLKAWFFLLTQDMHIQWTCFSLYHLMLGFFLMVAFFSYYNIMRQFVDTYSARAQFFFVFIGVISTVPLFGYIGKYGLYLVSHIIWSWEIGFGSGLLTAYVAYSNCIELMIARMERHGTVTEEVAGRDDDYY